jgi:hypothetical protein
MKQQAPLKNEKSKDVVDRSIALYALTEEMLTLVATMDIKVIVGDSIIDIAPREGDYEHTGAPRCSDYDDECKDVPNPFKCWSNWDGSCPSIADGYCPMLFKQ